MGWIESLHGQVVGLDNAPLAQQYWELLSGAKDLTMQVVTPTVAEEAARAHGLRTPDAIQLASALLAGASSFLTNDAQMARVPGLRMLILDQLLTNPGPAPAQVDHCCSS